MLAPRFVTSESDPLVAIADAVVVLVHEHAGKRVLAVHRREQPEWRCLPGGRIERRESAREAARRELAEETGLQLYRHELTFLGASDLAVRARISAYKESLRLAVEDMAKSVEHQ